MAQLLFEELHIALRFLGQVIPALAAGNIPVPAGQHRDHRLHPVEVGQGIEAGDFHTIQLVTGDDRDLLHAAEDIQLGEGDLIRPLTGQTVPTGHAIKGADPAGTACGRTVFPACLAQLLVPVLAHGVLSGKRTGTYAGGIRFQHAHHMVEAAVGDAGPQRCVSCQRVGLNRVKFSLNPYNINRLTLKAGKAALEDTAYFEKTCAAIVETRSWTKQQLEARGFTVLDSRANFLFASTGKKGGGELYRKLKEKGVLVRHFDAPRITDWLRITIGTPEDMEALLRALDEILEG